MALLVFTDFICWFPIALFAICSCFGAHLITLEQVCRNGSFQAQSFASQTHDICSTDNGV
jgi:hypothetical protein